jgi:stage II sporulation protein GA (sporulation sigma-E factor processing peptidase)
MGRRFRLLPYRAVGVAHGLLLAVRTDKAVLGDRELKGLLVALSPTPVSDGGGYQALMGDLEGINWEASA